MTDFWHSNNNNNLRDKTYPEDIDQQQQYGGTSEEYIPGADLEIDLEDLVPALPPDGGWGWMIVLGSFLCMVLVDGMCFSYGIFLSALEETFQASKMQMTLGGSLLTGFYFACGPVASGLLNKFSHRPIVFAGTLISTSAILGSTFVYNLNLFIVLFGVFGGIGYGLIYLPAATIVSTWFVKKRATVTGIVAAGSGIGGMVYSLVLPVLIKHYTWRGCIVILSGINLNCALAAALFRNLDEHTVMKELNRKQEQQQQTGDVDTLWNDQNDGSSENCESLTTSGITKQDSNMIKSTDTMNIPGQNRTPGKQINYKQLAQQYLITMNENEIETNDDVDQSEPVDSVCRLPIDFKNLNYSKHKFSHYSVDANAGLTSTDRLPIMSMEAINRTVDNVLNKQTIASSTSLAVPDHFNRSKYLPKTSNVTQPPINVNVRPSDTAIIYSRPDHLSASNYFASGISLKTTGDFVNDQNIRDTVVRELRKEISRPLHRKDLFLGGSLIHVNEFVSNTDVASYVRSVIMPAEEADIQQPVYSMMKKMLGIELLKSPTFILLIVSSMFSMIGYCIPYQFLKDYSQLTGVDEISASHLLAYLGGCNTVGRILSGWLSDRSWVNILYVNNVTLLISGLLTSLTPLFQNYLGQIFYACFFGFFIAAFVSLRTILIVELLGLDNLTNSFGFLLLFQAFALIIAPPSFGSLFDLMQNFNLIFILGGISLIISGLLCIPLKRLAKWEFGPVNNPIIPETQSNSLAMNTKTRTSLSKIDENNSNINCSSSVNTINSAVDGNNNNNNNYSNVER